MKLSDVPIADPCHADWDSMDVQGARRFCEQCDKHVHDLSSMTQTEAASLVASRGKNRLCVRYRVKADGTIRFVPRSPNLVPAASLSRPRASRVAGLGSAAALTLAVAACTPHARDEVPPRQESVEANDQRFVQGRLNAPPETPPVEEPELMGDIAEPEPEPEVDVLGELVAEPEPEQIVKGEVAPAEDAQPCEKPSGEATPAKGDVPKMGKIAPH